MAAMEKTAVSLHKVTWLATAVVVTLAIACFIERAVNPRSQWLRYVLFVYAFGLAFHAYLAFFLFAFYEFGSTAMYLSLGALVTFGAVALAIRPTKHKQATKP